MNNFSRKAIIFIITFHLLNLYGCNNSNSEQNHLDGAIETSMTTNNFSDEATISNETEKLTPLNKAVQEISYMYTQSGNSMPELALLCFTKETTVSGTLTEIDKNGLPMNDGNLKIGLNLFIYSPEEIDYKVKGTFVLFWNNHPFDFFINGIESTNGELQLEIPYNQDIVFPFEVKNMPIKRGRNEFYLCFVPYCEETKSYITPQRYYSYFNSEKSKEGIDPLIVTDERELPQECITVVIDKDSAETYYPIDSKYVIKSNKDRYSLHSNPSFNLNISNMISPDNTSNHLGIAMLFSDGELQPVWNNQNYLSVSLTKKEYLKTISVETFYKTGEKRDICMVYAELENSQELDHAPFLYSEISYCEIME